MKKLGHSNEQEEQEYIKMQQGSSEEKNSLSDLPWFAFNSQAGLKTEFDSPPFISDTAQLSNVPLSVFEQNERQQNLEDYRYSPGMNYWDEVINSNKGHFSNSPLSFTIEDLPKLKSPAELTTNNTDLSYKTRMDALTLETLEENCQDRVNEIGEIKGCICRKIQCLKLYCECFANKVKCTSLCKCINCKNNESFEMERKAVVEALEHKNKDVFIKPPKKSCNCKKSQCLKKYCECYQAGMNCSVYCKCVNCSNKGSSFLNQF